MNKSNLYMLLRGTTLTAKEINDILEDHDKARNFEKIDKIYLNELSWGDIIRENTDLKGNINYLNNELDQIETENTKLKQSNDTLELQVRALKLQREVKNTRLIMMTKERDDYKDKYQGHHGAYYHSLELYNKEIDKVTKLQEENKQLKQNGNDAFLKGVEWKLKALDQEKQLNMIDSYVFEMNRWTGDDFEWAFKQSSSKLKEILK